MRKLTFDQKVGPKPGDWVMAQGCRVPVNGPAKVLRVDESGLYLVEFLSSHSALHDGNNGAVRGKAKHCWWVSPYEISPAEEKDKIIRCGRNVICHTENNAGVATCSEGEKFDLLTGAIIAMARAHGVNPTKAAMQVLEAMSSVEKAKTTDLKIQNKFGTDFGKVGDPTPYKDSLGTALYVGDEVEVKNTESSRTHGLRWVASTKEDGPFVMGICLACNPKTGKIRDDWEVTLRTSYKERFAGEESEDGVLSISAPKDDKQQRRLAELNKEGRA